MNIHGALPPVPERPAPRRIALLSDGASPLDADGGAQGEQAAQAAGLARALALDGHLVDVFTRRAAPGHKQVVHWRDRLRVIHVPTGPAHPLPPERTLPCVPAFARFVIRFARHQAVPYDIVHAHFFTSGAIALHVKGTLGTPIAMTFHALGQRPLQVQGQPPAPPHDMADVASPARLRIERQLMAEAGRLIAESPQDAVDMARLHGVDPARIAVVPIGFDPEVLWPGPQAGSRVRLGLAPGRFSVLQVGRIGARQGIDTAIQATALLRSRHGIDAQLLVVGVEARAGAGQDTARTGEGAETMRLRELAERLDVAGHVHFLGPQRHGTLRHYYGAADAVVSIPRDAPFGAAPVEAMACARPVVGAEVGGIEHTVIDGGTGFLVPSRDPQATAHRLAMLHARPDLARRMGEAGLRRARLHFTWRHVARQADAVYAAIIAEATARLPADLVRS